MSPRVKYHGVCGRCGREIARRKPFNGKGLDLGTDVIHVRCAACGGTAYCNKGEQETTGRRAVIFTDAPGGVREVAAEAIK